MLHALIVSTLTAGALAAPTGDHDARVQVLGVGTVPLEHAARTCEEEAPFGDIRVAAGNTRFAAFHDILTGLAAQPAAFRGAYFHKEADPWPSTEREIAYVPPLPWYHAGLIGACEAAGAYWVRKGLHLAEVCRGKGRACREAFLPGEWSVVKGALKLANAPGAASDPLFVYLNAHDAQLESWSDPLPYLKKACDGPLRAAREGRFIDRDDLLAARRACLQIRLLTRRAAELAPLEQTCDTPWKEVEADLPHLVTSPHTDLGITADEAEYRWATERLARMDPSVVTCEGTQGALWRTRHAELWREAQATGACIDDQLPLDTRLSLCPDLLPIAEASCADGDGDACARLAGFHLRGITVDVDVDRGTELLLDACKAGHRRSCVDLADRHEVVAGWITDRLEQGQREALEQARDVVARYGPHLRGGWTHTQVQRVFDAAIAARYADLASALIDAFGPSAPDDWILASQAAVDALKAEPDR